MTMLTAPITPQTPKLSVPGAGSSLIASTERRAVHVRAAVDEIYPIFSNRSTMDQFWKRMLASRWLQEPLARSENPALHAAWALVSMRVIGRLLGQLDGDATLRDAEDWFVGPNKSEPLLSESLPKLACHRAVRELESFDYDNDLRDLLPYILDAIGPGSRASVIKDASSSAARKAKKTSGVFYTPTDVAEYITRESLSQHPKTPNVTVLDPACGSGVFLRAALNELRHQTELEPLAIAESSLFGIDINPLAIEAACFVLLHDCLLDHAASVSPWNVWHRLRCNFFVIDALSIERSKERPCPRPGVDELMAIREGLRTGYVPPASTTLELDAETAFFGSTIELGSFAPAIANGADVVVGNPPYAAIGERDDLASLEQRFHSLPSGRAQSADFYPLFLEMAWRLTSEANHSTGMVVPLSIAYSSRPQMTMCRRAMMAVGGRWRFAFFDREPHALFGEEVKTRNAIVFHQRISAGGEITIESGPLRKWTSRQRSTLFNSISFTPLKIDSLASGIPKLDGAEAALAYERIAEHTHQLREVCERAGATLPQDANENAPPTSVFVAGTGYNFLNVFRPHRRLPIQRAPWSASALTTLEFSDEAKASAAFALLSSRLVYWLWHVDEDGFHVTRSFVATLPFPSKMPVQALAKLGDRLWVELQDHQLVSVNGGRQTVAYRPHACGGTRDAIDALVLDALGLDSSFGAYLRAFTRSVVTVDEDDESRRQFTDHFSEPDVRP